MAACWKSASAAARSPISLRLEAASRPVVTMRRFPPGAARSMDVRLGLERLLGLSQHSRACPPPQPGRTSNCAGVWLAIAVPRFRLEDRYHSVCHALAEHQHPRQHQLRLQRRPQLPHQRLPTATPSPTPLPCTGSYTENFDGVTAPILPVGWTATNATGPTPLWVTSTSGTPSPAFDSSPNAAFVNDPAVVSDKRLDSPLIGISNPAAQLSFRNNYATESTFDGGVLEIGIGGGAFVDIVTAGGTSSQADIMGCYRLHLATPSSFHHPSRVRRGPAHQSGFITTTVNLPAAAAGQNIQLALALRQRHQRHG